MKLEFGNPEHIALAAKGAIPTEAYNSITSIIAKDGCLEACDHCIGTSYECENCGHVAEYEQNLYFYHENQKRCRDCKFIFS